MSEKHKRSQESSGGIKKKLRAGCTRPGRRQGCRNKFQCPVPKCPAHIADKRRHLRQVHPDLLAAEVEELMGRDWEKFRLVDAAHMEEHINDMSDALTGCTTTSVSLGTALPAPLVPTTSHSLHQQIVVISKNANTQATNAAFAHQPQSAWICTCVMCINWSAAVTHILLRFRKVANTANNQQVHKPISGHICYQSFTHFYRADQGAAKKNQLRTSTRCSLGSS